MDCGRISANPLDRAPLIDKLITLDLAGDGLALAKGTDGGGHLVACDPPVAGDLPHHRMGGPQLAARLKKDLHGTMRRVHLPAGAREGVGVKLKRRGLLRRRGIDRLLHGLLHRRRLRECGRLRGGWLGGWLGGGRFGW